MQTFIMTLQWTRYRDVGLIRGSQLTAKPRGKILKGPVEKLWLVIKGPH